MEEVLLGGSGQVVHLQEGQIPRYGLMQVTWHPQQPCGAKLWGLWVKYLAMNRLDIEDEGQMCNSLESMWTYSYGKPVYPSVNPRA